MRVAIGLIVVATCLAGCGSGSSADPGVTLPEAASCVGPQLKLSVSEARPGDTVLADGRWYAADCYDTGQRSNPPPLTGLGLSVVQAGKSWHVASDVNAVGARYRFHVPLALPIDLQPGVATVRVDGVGGSATLHVRRDK